MVNQSSPYVLLISDEVKGKPDLPEGALVLFIKRLDRDMNQA